LNTSRQLCVPSTFFQKQYYNTWNSHTIDFLILPKEHHRLVQDSGVAARHGVGESDHIATKTIIRLVHKFKKKGSKTRQGELMKDTADLPLTKETALLTLDFWNPAAKLQYRMRTKEAVTNGAFDQLAEPHKVLDIDKMNNAFTEMALETYPKKGPKMKDWFRDDQDTLFPLLEQRNVAEQHYYSEQSPDNSEKRKAARKSFKRAIATAKEKWLEKQVLQVHEMHSNPYEAWRAINRIKEGLYGHHRKPRKPPRLVSKDGQIATTDQARVEIFKEHLQGEVFGIQSSYSQEAVDSLPQHTMEDTLGRPFELDELKCAIRKAKNHKAPGESGVPMEIWKTLDDLCLPYILDTLNEYCTNKDFDSDGWHTVVLTLVPKKGDPDLAKNYRPIALIETLNKLLASMIAMRLDGHQNEVGLKNQAGFRSGYGCPNAVGALKVALQNLSESGQDAYVLFVDIIKAFDTVNREMLWQILAKYGIPSNLISVIKKLYNDITVKFRVGKAKGSFESTSGVKQGDPLAPVLFLYVMQAAVETMDKTWQGRKPQFEWCPVQHDDDGQPSYRGCLTQRNNLASQCEQHEHYSNLLADDLALIFLTMVDLIHGTKHVRDCFLLFGLKIHIGVRGGGKDGTDSESKSLAMHVPKIEDRKNMSQIIQPGSYDLEDGTFVPFCTKFKYLGSTITCDLDDTTEIKCHLSLAQMAFNEFRKILCNQRFNVRLRRQLFLMCVVSVLLAGCETWETRETSGML
jgi:hypothetical protein